MKQAMMWVAPIVGHAHGYAGSLPGSVRISAGSGPDTSVTQSSLAISDRFHPLFDLNFGYREKNDLAAAAPRTPCALLVA
eukprot:16429868-Heterocapsa_arctica.AAC.1